MTTDAGKAVLTDGGKSIELPITPATEGNSGYGIGKLMAATGNTTLDPGFTNTASCSSAITYIDGDQGILRYRGYPIEQLAEKSSFLEVAFLVIYGELPTGSSSRSSSRRSPATPCSTSGCATCSAASRAGRTPCRCCPRA